MITTQIIADSISPKGLRLTTFVLEFPRWILAELNTHRMLSRNVASSRAIPIEKMIEMVLNNPAVPTFYGKNQSGMQSKEELSDTILCNTDYNIDGNPNPYACEVVSEKENAKRIWLHARNNAVNSARLLARSGMHKQYVNRLIENFMNVRAIVSGTDFENFFALRAHPDAQPEFQDLAYKMLELYNNSTPKKLAVGEWHIPFGDKMDDTRLEEIIKKYRNDPNRDRGSGALGYKEAMVKIAIARCARISYQNYEGKDDYEADIKLCDRLFGSVPRHLSPTEHVAQALDSEKYIGNFCGFKQYRYMFTDQNLKDNRIIKK